MAKTLEPQVFSAILAHLKGVIHEEIDLSIDDFKILLHRPKRCYVTADISVPEVDSAINFFSIVNLGKDALGDFYVSSTYASISLISVETATPFICTSSAYFSSNSEITLRGNNFWRGLEALTGFVRKGEDSLILDKV